MNIVRGVLGVVLLLTGCQKTPTTEQKAAEPSPVAVPAVQPVKVTTEGYPKTVGGRVVLATAPAGGKLQYEIAIGECAKGKCPVLVSVIEGEKVLDQKHTEWAATTREVRTEKLEPGWGVGDPAPAELTAWAAGEEEKYLGTVVRAVALAPDVVGLLIDQRTGFEHVKRRHELWVAQGGKLERVWQAGEASGPVSTSTAITKTEGGAEAIVYVDGLGYPGPERPDSLKVTTFAWAGGKLAERQTPAQVVVLSGFATIQAARQYQAKQQSCVGWYYVLPAAQVDGAEQTGFVLALPTANAEQARAKAAEAAKCATGKKPVVVSMR